MALPTGGGTETVHTHLFEDVDGGQTLIYGVQHHVYTITSLVVYCQLLLATTDQFWIQLIGWDCHGGSSGQEIRLAKRNIQEGETFVWNDRFSFNGTEPTGESGQFGSGSAGDNDAYQIAIAAQGSTNRQYLQFQTTDVADDYDLVLTYIDQDWT